MKQRVGINVEAADMKLRQRDEAHAVGGQTFRSRQVDGLPEPHAVRDDRALGMARGARRIQNGRDIVVGQWFRYDIVRGGGEQRLVPGVAREAMRDPARRRQFRRRVRELRVVDQQDGGAIANDEAQLWHGQAPVHRNEYRAETAAGELDLEQIGGVVRQHRDPVAAFDVVSGS